MGNRMIIEQQKDGHYRRLTIGGSDTPEWDSLKNDLAGSINSFASSFLAALVPSILLGLLMVIMMLVFPIRVFR